MTKDEMMKEFRRRLDALDRKAGMHTTHFFSEAMEIMLGMIAETALKQDDTELVEKVLTVMSKQGSLVARKYMMVNGVSYYPGHYYLAYAGPLTDEKADFS